MVRLGAMAFLIAIVGTGGLSVAGRRRCAPLPTISPKISELELTSAHGC